MNIQLLHESILSNARFSFSKSGGPGGQNVNKVNSKASLEIPISLLLGLSEEERSRIENKLKHRISSEGCLYLSIDEDRSQLINRERALTRAEELLVQAAHIPKKRKATKPTRGSVLDRLKTKKQKGSIKDLRRKPITD